MAAAFRLTRPVRSRSRAGHVRSCGIPPVLCWVGVLLDTCGLGVDGPVAVQSHRGRFTRGRGACRGRRRVFLAHAAREAVVLLTELAGTEDVGLPEGVMGGE